MSESTQAVIIPDDVRAFLRQQGVECYIEPLLESVQRHFPNSEPRLTLDEDPEVEDLCHVRIGIRNRIEDMEDFFAARNAYKRDLFRIVPKPLTWVFRFGLERGDDPAN